MFELITWLLIIKINLLVLQDAGAKTTLGHSGFSFYLGTLKRIRAILAVDKVRIHTKRAFLCTAVEKGVSVGLP